MILVGWQSAARVLAYQRPSIAPTAASQCRPLRLKYGTSLLPPHGHPRPEAAWQAACAASDEAYKPLLHAMSGPLEPTALNRCTHRPLHGRHGHCNESGRASHGDESVDLTHCRAQLGWRSLCRKSGLSFTLQESPYAHMVVSCGLQTPAQLRHLATVHNRLIMVAAWLAYKVFDSEMG